MKEINYYKQNEILDLEKEIYFKGSMDAYYYFKKIGVIN